MENPEGYYRQWASKDKQATNLDINDIADLVHSQVLAECEGSMVAKLPREHVPCTSSVSIGVTHF